MDNVQDNRGHFEIVGSQIYMEWIISNKDKKGKGKAIPGQVLRVPEI